MTAQDKGIFVFLLLTLTNCILASLMVFELVSVPFGMTLCFLTSSFWVIVATLWLMGNERPWQRPNRGN